MQVCVLFACRMQPKWCMLGVGTSAVVTDVVRHCPLRSVLFAGLKAVSSRCTGHELHMHWCGVALHCAHCVSHFFGLLCYNLEHSTQQLSAVGAHFCIRSVVSGAHALCHLLATEIRGTLLTNTISWRYPADGVYVPAVALA